MLKYIAYCRKSRDEKDKQVLSIEAQIEELKIFAKRECLEIVKFITEAKTAKVPGRKEFEKLLQLIEAGKANGILAWHADRLARNSIDGGKIIYLLDRGKLLDLKFPTLWFENTPQGKFVLSIAFSQSKYYIDNLAQNVKRGIRQKLRRGQWPHKAPAGYINEPRLRTIEVDPKKSKAVKKAFQIFAKGKKSFTEISRFLFKHNVSYKPDKPFKIDAIRRILTNKFYIGIMEHGGEYHKGSHQCFISKKLFNKVQKQIKKLERPRRKGHNFPFMGLASCGECRATITAETKTKYYPTTRNKAKYIYYRCTKKLKPCTQKYLRQKDFEKQLRSAVAKCGLHPQWKPHFDKWIEKDRKRDELNAKQVLQKLKKEVNEVDLKLNRLLDAYLDQVIESKIYKQKKNELFEEKLKLEEQILKIQRICPSWLGPMREFINYALQAQKITKEKNKKRELAAIAKKIGSDFSLKNQKISIRLHSPWRLLAAKGGAASSRPSAAAFSILVAAPERCSNFFSRE